MKIRENNNDLHFGVNDFEDGEFYGFRSDFEQRKEEIQEELRNAIASYEYAISTFGEIRKNGKKKN